MWGGAGTVISVKNILHSLFKFDLDDMKESKNKGIEAFSLPDIIRKQITALIKAGYYSSRSDVIKDSFRTFLDAKPQLKIAAAVYLYKEKLITKEEALLISGKNDKDFDIILKGKK